jgi:hypothetical protein
VTSSVSGDSSGTHGPAAKGRSDKGRSDKGLDRWRLFMVSLCPSPARAVTAGARYVDKPPGHRGQN